MIELLIPLVIGFIMVGATTVRTIQVIDGKPLNTFMTNLVFSVCYFYGTSYIVNRDAIGYTMFSIGAGLSTSYLAYRNKRKKDEKRKRSDK